MLTGNAHNTLKSLHSLVQEVNGANNLDQVLALIVRRVKVALGADVCSVYLSIGDARDRLMLMATDGLNPSAVGQVVIERDTGLVGQVARKAESVNLGNAPAHPSYRYFPETGEERYHAFLGAPIIHHGDVLGVLVVQSHRAEPFVEEMETFLFTIAAQLSGAILHAEAQGRLGPPTGGVSEKTLLKGEFSGPVQGQPGAPGVAIGRAVLIHPFAAIESVPDRHITDVEAELEHFREALERVRSDVHEMLARMHHSPAGQAQAGLFDAYLMMLDSDSLVEGIELRIRSGVWAPAALREVVLEHVKAFDAMEDPYLRERAQDVRDLARRVLEQLEQGADGRLAREYPKDTVLVGEEITASMLAEVPQTHLVGVVSVRGSRTSHMAMLASAFGIPAVMGAEGLPLKRVEGAAIIADGYSGRLYLNPDEAVSLEYIRLQREEEELAAGLRGLRHQPAVTVDGFAIELMANTGLVADIRPAQASGAQGVGLYRTEFPFMIRERFPSEEEQRAVYQQVLDTFHPLPVVMRTLDIGGDKNLSYFPIVEENPFLGWRGIRVTLDHPEIFMIQLRAMLRANAGLGNLQILLPMVTSLREVISARGYIDRAYDELVEEGYKVTRPKVGVMIEVPAAIYLAPELARRVDFFSLGTNDLAQYLLAVDRNNVHVSDIFDTLHPSLLRAIKQVVEVSEQSGVPVSVCGEMASDPCAALALIGMGIKTLSMSASGILRIKWLVRSFTLEQAYELYAEVSQMEAPAPIRAHLETALRDAGLGGLVRAGKS